MPLAALGARKGKLFIFLSGCLNDQKHVETDGIEPTT